MKRASVLSLFCLLLQYLQDIPPRRAADSPSAVGTTATQIEVIDRRPVIRPTRNRAHEQKLIQHELTMINVAFGETVGLLEVKRGDGFTIYDCRFQMGEVFCEGVDCQIFNMGTLIVPVASF